MLLLLLTGLLAGALLGAVLARWDLCFHAMFTAAWRGETTLLRGWLLGVGIGSVGLSVVYAEHWFRSLNQGLPFRPVGNVVGGLLIGAGMVVARSCSSGLFYKLGTGMLGASVGIAGWVVGELAVHDVDVPGPTVLSGGAGATIPALLGVPRLVGSLLLLLAVVGIGVALAGGERTWVPIGLTVGVALVAGWVLAGAGGASFGPSTVGESVSMLRGHPLWWLLGFLLGLVLGGHLGARRRGTLRRRGETGPRYVGLAVGGFLLGAGGWIAGGCNLGHGLSGAAQLNVSSWVVVLAMAAGVGLTTSLEIRLLALRPTPRPARPLST